MFNSFRQLISEGQETDSATAQGQQTPTRSGNGTDSNLEFTPIGSTGDMARQNTLQFDHAHKATTTRISEQAQQRLPKNRDAYSSRLDSQQDTEILRTIRKNSRPLHRTRIDNNGYESATSTSALEESDAENTTRQSGLFGRSVIRDGTDVFPPYNNEKITERIVEGEESNMVKKQAELLQHLKAENMNLRVELRTLWSLPRDQGKLAQQIVSLNKQLLIMKEQNEELKGGLGTSDHKSDEIIDLKRQLDELDLQLHDKDHMYQTVREEKDDLIQEKLKMTDEIDILNNKIDQYEFKLRDMVTRDSGSEMISQLERDVHKMEANIARLENENHTLTDENHQLRADLNKLEEELDGSSNNYDKMRELEISKGEMESKIDDLNEALDMREAEIQELKSQQSDMRHEKSQLELKLEVMEAKQQTGNLGAASNNKRVEEMTNRLVEASESIDQMDLEIENKDKIIKNLSNSVKELNKRIDSLMDDNENLNSILKHNRESEVHSKEMVAEDIQEVQTRMRKLQMENSTLKDTIDDLESKLKKMSNDSFINELESSKKSLERELEKAKERLNSEISFRKELELKLSNGDDEITYEDIENLRSKIEAERDSFQDELGRMSDVIKGLVYERDNALDDLDKVEDEKMDLIRDFETIQREYQVTQRHEQERDISIDSLKQDLEKLSVQYKIELDSHENTRELLMNQIDQLKAIIENRNTRVIKLEAELAGALRETYEDKGSTKLVDELSAKVKTLVSERDNLVNERYKLGEQLNRVTAERDQHKYKLENQATLLRDIEANLKSLNKERKLLQKKLSVKSDDIDDLTNAIDELKIQNTKISTGVDEIISHEGKILKNNALLVESVNDNREDVAKLRAKLEETYRDYNELRESLLNKIESVREERNEARSQLDNSMTNMNTWKAKSERFEKRIKGLEDSLKIEQSEKLDLLQRLEQANNSQFPPTPISPSKSSENVIRRLKFELEICELQKQLLNVKLRETCERYDDQKYQNKYFQAEIDSKNETIQRNYRLIRESGIEVSFKEKLTQFSGRSRLRIAFLIVLASVRMKKRLEETAERKRQIQTLKREIVRRRYLAERL